MEIILTVLAFIVVVALGLGLLFLYANIMFWVGLGSLIAGTVTGIVTAFKIYISGLIEGIRGY